MMTKNKKFSTSNNKNVKYFRTCRGDENKKRKFNRRKFLQAKIPRSMVSIYRSPLYLFSAHPQGILLRNGPEGSGEVRGAVLSQLVQLPAHEAGALPELAAPPGTTEERSPRSLFLAFSVWGGVGGGVCVCVCV